MKKLSLLFVASAIAVGSAYACGGEEPAKNPNDVGSASATATSSGAPSATADMPSATASVTATASTPPPPPEPPPIAVDGIKVSGKGKDGKALAVEVKPDGGVMKDGKTLMATFAKNELKDDKGATIFAIALDGKVSSPAMPNSTWAFNDKDELQSEGKTVLSIGDDGVVTWMNNGKAEKSPFKFEKLPAKSKRAALLLAALWWLPKPAAAPAGSASAVPSAKPSAAPSAKPSAAPSARPK